MGVNSELLEIEQTKLLQFSLWVLVRNRLTNFRIWIVNVHGPAQHDLSTDFVLELSDSCSQEDLPLLLGRDFNLIRSNKDRNRGSRRPAPDGSFQ